VLHDGRMTLVYRHEGRRGPGGSPEDLLQGLSAAMERFQPVLVAAQADRVEREATTVSGRRCDACRGPLRDGRHCGWLSSLQHYHR